MTMKKEIEKDANGYRKFGMRDKLAYAAGDLGCNMSFSLKGTVQTFWLVFMTMETGLLSLLLLLRQQGDHELKGADAQGPGDLIQGVHVQGDGPLLILAHGGLALVDPLRQLA